MKNRINQKVKTDVLIVDSQPVYAAGLEQILSKDSLSEIAGIISDYKKALRFVKKAPPHVIIMDIFSGTVSAFDFIKEIMGTDPNIKILVLSMLDENIYAERALKAGARGYLLKTASQETIIRAVEKINKNELFLSDNLSSNILQKYVGGVENIELNPVKLLSDRELDVYRLTGKGHTSREISLMLGISVNTVDNHKSNIKDKLGFKNSIELIQNSVLWYREVL
ncbi:MAG: response regulator transcription factor [Spirochaetota bacterium]